MREKRERDRALLKANEEKSEDSKDSSSSEESEREDT
jgi:hypothetical protein